MTSRRLLLVGSAAAALRAAEWPQWRGPARDGRAAETGLLKQWPANGPKVVWTATGLGEGYSSFSVAGGRLFTQGQQGRTEFVFAYDAATGRKLWATPAGGSYNESRGNGPRGTPTVDGPMLYSMSADGTLTAISKADGKKQWEQNVVDKFGGAVAHWGMSESPLIDGNRVIVQPGAAAPPSSRSTKPMESSFGSPAATARDTPRRSRSISAASATSSPLPAKAWSG